jgi:MATE family multidrug resistance protein
MQQGTDPSSAGPVLTTPARSPLAEVLLLAGPTVAQMASYTVMQFIDTWMLAKALGPLAPTAASNAGGLSFAFVGFGVGVLQVVNTLVSQSFGRRDFAECGRYLWQGVWFALGYAAMLLPLMFVMPRWFAAFGHPPEMVAMERVYVHFMIAGAALMLTKTAFSQFLLATNRPTIPLWTSVCGVSVNAMVAYAVVFGKFGVPQLGVTGAALAQTIGIGVELMLLATFALRPRDRVTFNTGAWRLRRGEFATLLSVGFGSGIQLIAEVLAWSLFMNWVMGALGANAMAASAFMLRYLILSFLPALGISSAVTALVGRYIGMGRPDLAMHRAHLGFKVALVYLLTCGLVYFFGRRELIELFTTQDDVVRLGSILLIFAAVYQVFDGLYIVYYGALRGAGDTFVPAIATAVLCWGIMVGGGYVVARTLPRFSVAGPWTVASVYGIILGVFMYLRFRAGKWQSIRLEEDAGSRGFDITLGSAPAISAVNASHDQ